MTRNGHDLYCFCGCGNGQRANGQPVPRRKREFPPDNATVGGEPGYATQKGDRTQAWWGSDKLSEIVTNDGVNAAYIREGDIDVVDENNDDPYTPKLHRW